MQNVQNTAEIQQRVINLVELYRTKVGKESQIAKDAKEEKMYWDEENLNAAIKLHEDGMKGPIGIDMSPDMPDEWVKTLRVNDHLLGHFYSVVAGNNADKDVLSEFLADYYDTSVFTVDEEEFLRSHFKEMVNYIIQTPCDNLDSVNHHDGKDWQLIPNEVLQLVKSRIDFPAGSVIYNPFSGFAQFPLLFPESKFLCEDSYASYNKRWNVFSEKCHKESNIVLGMHDVNLMTAWMKIALYANSINSIVIEDGMIPTKYDSVVSFIPRIPNAIPEQAYELDLEIPSDPDIINKLLTSYENLPKGGKYVLILPKESLWASNPYYSLRSLWEKMVKENSLDEIIQMPCVMSLNSHHDNYCMIIVEKGRKGDTTTLIDARFATIKSNDKDYDEILDLSLLENMLANDGKESTTGLRKMVKVSTKDLNIDILIPQIYVVEKPLYEETPLPLSKFGTLATTRIRSLQIDLPEDTPWVELSDLSHSFQGELDVTALKKAGCPNNPKFVEGSEEYSFSKSGKFIDDFWAQTNSKNGSRVYDYRRCTYVDGLKDVVLFRSSESGIGSAVVRGTNKPMAIGLGIKAFILKDGVDALTLIAILRLPVVHRQMQAYAEFGLAEHLDDILVPTDMRILFDEKHRLLNEAKVHQAYEDELIAKKTDYINEVRMRKHDMGQYIFELVNIEDLMRYYVENRDKEQNFCQELETLLDNFKSSLGELSTLLADLSKEEQFGEPELFNIDEFLSKVSNRHRADGFKIEYNRDDSSIKRYYQKVHADELAMLDDFIPEDEADSFADFIPEDEADSYADFIPEDEADSFADFIPEDEADSYADFIPEDEADSYADFIPEENTDSLDDFIPDDAADSFADFIPEENTDSLDDFIPEENTDSLDDFSIEEETSNSDPITIRNETPPPLFVSPKNLQRLVSNIIDNARKHGFTDHNRKDYEVKINMSIDAEKKMFLIDFSNNGTPLPEGMDKMRYGIKGEKAGITGGTGIGGSYVKKFVEHYGGDYDIFMDNGWTVVRIYLPIK
jgi:signal transduction histidine kinase